MRAKNVQVDFAKKAGKWVVDVARSMSANTIVLEGLWEKYGRGHWALSTALGVSSPKEESN